MKQWKCEHCHGPIGPVSQLAGQTVACPYCLAPIQVPSDDSNSRRKRAKWRQRIVWCAFLIFVGASAALIFKPKLLPEVVYGYRMPGWLLTLDQELTRFVRNGVSDMKLMVVADDETLELQAVTPHEQVVSVSSEMRASRIASEKIEGIVHSAVQEVLQTTMQESVNEAVKNAVEPLPPGLGVERGQLVHAIQEYVDATFYERDQFTGDLEEMKAEIAGIEITIRGPDAEVESVMVAGSFEDQNMALLLAAIIDQVMPSWQVEDAGDWFCKAVERCDSDTFVSTLRDEVELSLTDAGNEKFLIFLQADRE
ncbi:MAG: hypothetical protein MK179_15105 [Pirellulaceae bacterium]|nr:hypothetical protein [Pirellulaceae bacterium]